MSRPKLPQHARRVQVSLTLSSAALAILDAFVAAEQAATRSAAAETAIMAWFAAAPRPGERPSRPLRVGEGMDKIVGRLAGASLIGADM